MFGPGPPPSVGAIYVYRGGTTLSTTPLSILGTVSGGRFGLSGGAGDVDGDGYSDLIVGAANANGSPGTGFEYLFLGNRTSVLGTSYVASWPGEYAGVIGDVNGDGYSDWGAAMPDATVGGTASNGQVAIYLGGTTITSLSTPVVTISAPDSGYANPADGPTGALFGTSMPRVGDLNGDGWADLIVDAEYALGEGRAYEYLSNGTTFTSTAVAVFTGPGLNARFGQAVALQSKLREPSPSTNGRCRMMNEQRVCPDSSSTPAIRARTSIPRW